MSVTLLFLFIYLTVEFIPSSRHRPLHHVRVSLLSCFLPPGIPRLALAIHQGKTMYANGEWSLL